MLNKQPYLDLDNATSPDYDGLIRFLVEPLLESPELLSFHCEYITSTKRIWIRLALEEKEKGRVYGKGGRNIQAIRTVLQTAAQMVGDTLYLEVHEDQERGRFRSAPRRKPSRSSNFTPRSRSNGTPRPPIKRRGHVNKPVIE
ncbi:KH domain-containing protein [Cyanobacterium stanieri LEGE 03274]|uniref:KH domain-containing protein n=1 Tax=Cyanobacterium stanieri LEGE 03274 TaxID=1828756 RepID=A0ABR9V7R5_9CHRO|nr:KH domain-containing protein [Cyanobacterium stanieri]MBE9223584.1 KH domain-containing protein [Cyanobacterium stanieri LEGE 03274]